MRKCKQAHIVIECVEHWRGGTPYWSRGGLVYVGDRKEFRHAKKNAEREQNRRA